MTSDRCTTCDREACPSLQPSEHIESRRGECPACAASIDCHAHRVDWRARALAAEGDAANLRSHIDAAGDGLNLPLLLNLYRDRAERSEDDLAKASLTLGIILDRLGARDTGTGGQTVEAGNARIVHDGMRRLDRAIAAAARWRKVAPLIETLHQASMIEAGDPMHVVDAAMELLAATQEPTP